MNIVNRSIEMKNPNTPTDSNISQRKNCRGSGSIFQEAKLPANTMMEDRSSMAMDIPSTPTARLMLSGLNHAHDPT